MIIMSPMSEITEIKEIQENGIYSSTEVALFVGLTARHVVRLADEGHFDGWYRKSPVAGSPRVFPAAVVLAFLEARKKNK